MKRSFGRYRAIFSAKGRGANMEVFLWNSERFGTFWEQGCLVARKTNHPTPRRGECCEEEFTGRIWSLSV